MAERVVEEAGTTSDINGAARFLAELIVRPSPPAAAFLLTRGYIRTLVTPYRERGADGRYQRTEDVVVLYKLPTPENADGPMPVPTPEGQGPHPTAFPLPIGVSRAALRATVLERIGFDPQATPSTTPG